MIQTRSFSSSLLLIVKLIHAALLPAPQIMPIESVNMKHVLKWSPLQTVCPNITYSVKFQGEYEIHMRNSTWVEAYNCQGIDTTECDLTSDLASDSDYRIAVQAQCEGRTSWAQLPKTFNRRDTVLLAPHMTVHVSGGRIEVFFQQLHQNIITNLKLWKEGEEQNVFKKVIKKPQFSYNVQDEEGRYCLQAEALLEDKSNCTETQCVHVTGPGPLWIIYVIAGLAVTLTVGVALVLGVMTPRCGPRLRKAMFHKEPLPSALLVPWPKTMPQFSFGSEPTHSVLLLHPFEEVKTTYLKTETGTCPVL